MNDTLLGENNDNQVQVIVVIQFICINDVLCDEMVIDGNCW